jgi:hypothetical protein
MCYPCTGCNGCGKMDSELFGYLTPRLLCPVCETEYELGEECCAVCSARLPAPPGIQTEREIVSTEKP